MFEKVNPKHPDKIADRIAGAIVDYAYTLESDPKVAVEVLIGHGKCLTIIESSVDFNNEQHKDFIKSTVKRIAEVDVDTEILAVAQDKHLSDNQEKGIKCGDNGIFAGCPITREGKELTDIVKTLYEQYSYDGKYIVFNEKGETKYIGCQSHCEERFFKTFYKFNPLGYWTGGINVDSGATNRKLGSDMGGAVTGGGLHGKDLSKADVSVNIYAHLIAQKENHFVKCVCAIGDAEVLVEVGYQRYKKVPYSKIVEIARNYIKEIGGFEKFAEWGLIR